MNSSDILKQIDHLLDLGASAIGKQMAGNGRPYVPQGDFIGFKASSLSFISLLYGNKHPYFISFEQLVNRSYVSVVKGGISILEQIKHEVSNGWLIKIKEIVSAEVFASFLEMAEHLLDEGYKDAAAVMIGSVIEEHLRQLCHSHGVDTHYLSKGDSVPKKANLINADLKKAGVYGPLEEKQVLAWLALRNSAAHGSYSEYSSEQVKLMYQGVLDFLSRVK